MNRASIDAPRAGQVMPAPHDRSASAPPAQRVPIRQAPLVQLALAAAAGIGLAHAIDVPAGFAGVGLLLAASLGMAGICLGTVWRLIEASSAGMPEATRRTRRRNATALVLIATAALVGGWAEFRTQRLGEPALELNATDGRLVDLTGTVTEPPRLDFEKPTGLAGFLYTPPRTRWVIAVDLVHTPEGPVALSPTSARRLLVSTPALDDRVREGDRLRCRGWLRGIRPPSNPGQWDFKAFMAERGVIGRLHLRNRANWRHLTEAEVDQLHRIRAEASARGTTLIAPVQWLQRALGRAVGAITRNAARMRQSASEVMRYGMASLDQPRQAEAVALLEALLLGRRSAALQDIYESFRNTGLAHLLSISGLHVGILAAGLWWITLVISGRPRLALAVTVAAVIGYVLLVPARVPILRAGFMTVACLLGIGWARRVDSGTIMAVIGLVLLIWRPGDLFEPGFQLSFFIVAALLTFAAPVSRAILPRDPLEPLVGGQDVLRRIGVDYLAVSMVAWLAALPLVAQHFGVISPLAVILSILVLPMVALMLWLGFLKMLLTLLLPPAGALLAEPLLRLARWTVALATEGETLPGAHVAVDPPGWGWTLAVMALTWTALSGWFIRRRAALVTAIALCVGWLWVSPHLSRVSGRAPGPEARIAARHEIDPPPAAATASVTDGTNDPAAPQARSPVFRLDMLDVGDGSCYLLRAGGTAWLFDAGSGNFGEIGKVVIAPALEALGVSQLEAIVISHADLDHFSGVLAVVDHIPTRRILTTGHVLAEARAKPDGATHYLLAGLVRRQIPRTLIEAGWVGELGPMRVEALWPPADRRFERNNNASLVMRFTTPGGRRLLMTGDVQTEAMAAMMRDPDVDLRAEVTDLPHHGSFPPGAVRWLNAVDPRVVLQSSGGRRLRWDRWVNHLDGRRRFITHSHGWTSVRFFTDRLRVTTRLPGQKTMNKSQPASKPDHPDATGAP